MTKTQCNAANPLTCRFHGNPEARMLTKNSRIEIMRQEKTLKSNPSNSEYLLSIEREKAAYLRFKEIYGEDEAESFQKDNEQYRKSLRSHPSMGLKVASPVKAAPSKIERYGDVTLEHPWVKKYRIPVINHISVSHTGYIVALALPEANASYNLWKLETPTEDEAKIVASFSEYTLNAQGFYPSYLKQVHENEVDFDSGFNTITLSKRQDKGWGYNRFTWRNSSPYPDYNTETRYDNIVDLLDHIEKGYKEPIRSSWVKWKKEHNIS